MLSRILKEKYYTFRRIINIKKFPKKGNLIIVFCPKGTEIYGGILSIDSIYTILKKFQHLHQSDVVLSYMYRQFDENPVRFTKFNSNSFIQNFRTILNHYDTFQKLQIYIPEAFIPSFINECENFLPKTWLQKILDSERFSINIMNQNDDQMPQQKDLEWLKENLTENITITTAHKNYANLEKRKQYGFPTHYLSNWINKGEYISKSFAEKEDIIIISPDQIKDSTRFQKHTFVSYLENKLPNFSIIEVKNLTYEQYKNLISRAKFSITFGEGLDGYFTETSFCGGVSFAVFNNVFFGENYRKLPTIYSKLDELFDKVVKDIIKINSDKEKFTEINQMIKNEVQKEFSYQIYEKNMIRFLQNDIDFP